MYDGTVTLEACRELVEHNSLRPTIDSLILYGLLTGKVDPRHHAAGQKRERECYNPPDEADLIMHVADHLMGTYGVEALELPGGEYADYCNTGDPYIITLVHCDGVFSVCGWGDVIEEKEQEAEAEADPQARALAIHLGVSALTIADAGWDRYESSDAQGEYLVLTDDDADDRWDEALDEYIDECLDIPDAIKPYFDSDAWKRDARMDGRGHCLASYDGNEYDVDVDGITYYIYRVN